MRKSIITNPDEIKEYIKELKKIPVLSHERQDEIFEKLKNPETSKKEREELKQELVKGNLRFVISVAKGYQNQGLPLTDLISEGNIGLMKAAERFDPESGYRFISYAVHWVRQTIISALTETSRTIKIPSNIVQQNNKARKQKHEDSYYNDFYDTEDNSIPTCVSLFNDINEDGDQLIDLIPNKNADSPENIFNNFNQEEIKKRVAIVLSVLDERERVIIEKTFGLCGIEANLEDLGEEFDCTKERIRQLRDKAIKKLRNQSYRLMNYL